MNKQNYRNDLLDYGVYQQIRAKSIEKTQLTNNKYKTNKIQKNEQNEQEKKERLEEHKNNSTSTKEVSQQQEQPVLLERQSKLRKYRQQQQNTGNEILYNQEQKEDDNKYIEQIDNKFIEQNDIEIRLDFQAMVHIQQIQITQLDINLQCSFCQNQFQDTIKSNKQNELLLEEQCRNCQYSIKIRIVNQQNVLEDIKPNMIISMIKEQNTKFNIIKSFFEIYCQCGRRNEHLISSQDEDKILCQKCCYEMIAVGLRLI